MLVRKSGVIIHISSISGQFTDMGIYDGLQRR
jgi:hypothetical protein